MRKTIGGLLAALMAAAGGVALAGDPTDPNDGDEFVGKSGGIRYAQDSQLADSGGTLLAGCGSQKWRLIGGGAFAGPDPSTSYLKLGRGWDYTDPDAKPDDGWFAGGAGAPGSPVTATAICRRSGGLRYRSKDIPTNASNFATGKLGCGGRRWHVTTGSPFVGTSTGWINSSFPYDGGDRDKDPDDGWKIRAFASSIEVTVYAICARQPRVRYRVAKPITLSTESPSQRSKIRQVRCGKDEALGGGVKLSGLINRGWLVESGPVDSGDAGDVPEDRWRTRAYNVGGAPIKMTSYAICTR